MRPCDDQPLVWPGSGLRLTGWRLLPSSHLWEIEAGGGRLETAVGHSEDPRRASLPADNCIPVQGTYWGGVGIRRWGGLKVY